MSSNPLLEIFVPTTEGSLESRGTALLAGRDLVELLFRVARRRELPPGVSFAWLHRFDPETALADAAVLPDGTTGERPPTSEECSQPREVRKSLEWLLHELGSGDVPELRALWHEQERDGPYDRETLARQLAPDILAWLSLCDHAIAQDGLVVLDHL